MKGWNERRWFRFDGHAYIWATRGFSAPQQGMYMTLLCLAWIDSDARATDPPRLKLEDDERMARLCGVTTARWKKESPAVLALFRIEGGYLYSDELTRQWEGAPEGEEKPRRQRDNISPRLRASVLERDGFKCRRCGCGADQDAVLVIDHIVPVARGGKSDIENLQTLCFDCNAGKTDSPPHDHDLRIIG